MDIKYKYVQDEIMKNEIKLTLIGTNSMMADPLTKSISGPKLKYFSDFIMEMGNDKYHSYVFNYIVHYTTLLSYNFVEEFNIILFNVYGWPRGLRRRAYKGVPLMQREDRGIKSDNRLYQNKKKNYNFVEEFNIILFKVYGWPRGLRRRAYKGVPLMQREDPI
ncbi:hypothetical protein H8356DRAFT_1436446 [Neocallimastix lanati (nom. inval.)]|nr:hypothetical protein H8356DRAFT_1436446 [Neocallimastix sp. JGI-2020a]